MDRPYPPTLAQPPFDLIELGDVRCRRARSDRWCVVRCAEADGMLRTTSVVDRAVAVVRLFPQHTRVRAFGEADRPIVTGRCNDRGSRLKAPYGCCSRRAAARAGHRPSARWRVTHVVRRRLPDVVASEAHGRVPRGRRAPLPRIAPRAALHRFDGFAPASSRSPFRSRRRDFKMDGVIVHSSSYWGAEDARSSTASPSRRRNERSARSPRCVDERRSRARSTARSATRRSFGTDVTRGAQRCRERGGNGVAASVASSTGEPSSRASRTRVLERAHAQPARAARSPAPACQVPRAAGRRPDGLPRLRLPRLGLGIEVDGNVAHATPSQRAADNTRATRSPETSGSSASRTKKCTTEMVPRPCVAPPRRRVADAATLIDLVTRIVAIAKAN